MALPAELNGYPGPRHVLELQHELALTPGQLAAVETAFAEMAASAQVLGEQLIAAERTLDRLFAHGKATVGAVESASAGAAALRGRLRATHLRYHLEMVEVLTPSQVATYNRLRGYGAH